MRDLGGWILGPTAIDNLAASEESSPYFRFITRERRRMLRESTKTLAPRETDVLKLLYEQDATVREAAELLGVSHMTVCRIHKAALVKVRKELYRRRVVKLNQLF